MRRIYAVIELADMSNFDPSSDDDLDALAEDLPQITHGVTSAAVYPSLEELEAQEG